MPLVSEKVSAATETLRKIVLGNFAASPGRVDGTWPKKQRSEIAPQHPPALARLCYECANSMHRTICYESRSHLRRNATNWFRPVHGDLAGFRERCTDHLGTALCGRLACRHSNARSTGPCPSQYSHASVQKYLREALRIIRAATDISGDVPKALYWYRNEPLPIFDYKTAEQLVSEGRADDLLRYVVALDAGVAG